MGRKRTLSPSSANAAHALMAAVFSVLLASCSGAVPTMDEIKKDNRDSRAAQLVRVADTTRGAGDPVNAIQLYQRASEMRPGWTVPLVRLAETATKAGMLPLARDAYKRVHTLEAGNTDALVGLGRIGLMERDYAAALASFEEAARVAPMDNRGYNGAGIALDLMGRHAEAQDRYVSGIERAPDSLSLRNNLGLSLALTGNYAEAIAKLEDAAARDGAGTRTRLNLALVHGLSGNDDEAARIASADLGTAAVKNNLAFYARLRDMTPAERAEAIFGGGRQ